MRPWTRETEAIRRVWRLAKEANYPADLRLEAALYDVVERDMRDRRGDEWEGSTSLIICALRGNVRLVRGSPPRPHAKSAVDL